mmetsp:Transcript_29960/g.79909  ORF Transcript_29960/g.79909 Transcript_29960/m.79909 type:complete len:403 (-) Transcript_29960:64-1272(-)
MEALRILEVSRAQKSPKGRHAHEHRFLQDVHMEGIVAQLHQHGMFRHAHYQGLVGNGGGEEQDGEKSHVVVVAEHRIEGEALQREQQHPEHECTVAHPPPRPVVSGLRSENHLRGDHAAKERGKHEQRKRVEDHIEVPLPIGTLPWIVEDVERELAPDSSNNRDQPPDHRDTYSEKQETVGLRVVRVAPPLQNLGDKRVQHPVPEKRLDRPARQVESSSRSDRVRGKRPQPNVHLKDQADDVHCMREHVEQGEGFSEVVCRQDTTQSFDIVDPDGVHVHRCPVDVVCHEATQRHEKTHTRGADTVFQKEGEALLCVVQRRVWSKTHAQEVFQDDTSRRQATHPCEVVQENSLGDTVHCRAVPEIRNGKEDPHHHDETVNPIIRHIINVHAIPRCHGEASANG